MSGHQQAGSTFLSGGGKMGALMRSLDWSATPLGPVSRWPQSLLTAISICLASRFPILIWWGPELVMLYNDAYRPILGATKHPRALGQKGLECWPEIKDIIGPMLHGVLQRGEATWSEDQMLPLERNGFVEECYFTFSYSPIRDESGEVAGVFTAVSEVTERVLGERRLRTLRALAECAPMAQDPQEAWRQMAAVLADNPGDVPFALLYALDEDGTRARLLGSTGLAPGSPLGPVTLAVEDPAGPWPLARVARSGQAEICHDLPDAPRSGPWPEPIRTAIVLPIARPTQPRPHGFLVAGVSPRLGLGDAYRGLFDLLAAQVATVISAAHAYAEERRRAEALAQLDRAKTDFFSNVSHEFRTPITLLLGQTEELIERLGAQIGAADRERLDSLRRNGQRLLKLVNTLLDFARVEAGRIEASYERLDLGRLTAELASSFRSAVERAGMRLLVDVAPVLEPVYVDRDMWEKIVLNLLSNAFKFTLHGEIEVRVRPAPDQVLLTVRDTGVGLPPEELPRLFQRFHRVPGTQGRSVEGSGIGLALTQELVRLHGGSISVSSQVGQGSTFTVAIPLGAAHLPPERIGARRALMTTATGADAYVAEALRWLPGDDPVRTPGGAGSAAGAAGRILVVDDNVDMREYLVRLLSRCWPVEAVGDGEAALQAARRQPPALVLTDMMMPRLDGLGLLRALRAEGATRRLPVILLTARAGEEATIEGLQAGADECLSKPFSARELLARIHAQLGLARERAVIEGLVEELHQAAELRERLLAIVGHDLKNPLSAISMSAAVVLRREALGPQDRKSVERIQSSAARMQRLINQILDFARSRMGGGIPITLRSTDLRQVSQQVVDEVAAGNPGRTLALEAHGDCCGTWDGDGLGEVLSNLLGNAVQYSPGGPIQITLWGTDAEVRVAIHNQGPPIPAVLLPILFDPFKRAKGDSEAKAKSVGLGLYIAHQIVSSHGGRLEVSSSEDEGTTFTLVLPRHSVQPAAR